MVRVLLGGHRDGVSILVMDLKQCQARKDRSNKLIRLFQNIYSLRIKTSEIVR